MRIAALIAIAVLAAAPLHAGRTAEEAVAASRAAYAVADRECDRSGREIVVCGRRNANDRYRLPFETAAPGDPRDEGVWNERARLQANPGTCQGWAFFRAFCGSVGVSMSVGGGGARLGGARRAY